MQITKHIKLAAVTALTISAFAVERAYQRGSQLTKRAALMAEWAVYCATVPTDAVVKPIRGAA